MVMAQKLKEAEITEQDSLLLTRNLLRIAIFNISYIRGLFPEKYFNDKSVPALDMKIKKLMPMDAESRRLIDWMEKGVYDALQRKYLKTLMFCICETVDGPMIEEYAFSFSYSDSDSQDVMMNINRTGNKKNGGTFNSTADITPNQMRSSACKMVRTLVQLMRTLDKMPDERTIVMKLLYYDDVTPPDYEPPFFRGCTEDEAQYVWTKNPLRMEIGNVNSKHLVLTLKVKSVLDPCEDENDDMQDDGKSIGPDSVHDDQPSDSDSEISQTQENQFIVAPVEKQDDDDGEVDEDDNTQDPVENEQQLARVKDWINSRHLDTLELTDILANFPDISIVLSEEIMDQLVTEGVLSKTGKDTYIKKRDKTPESEFTFVKEEADGQTAPKDGKPVAPEDYLYMKALYHSLPMNYVTITKLHNMLDGEANQTAVRKLMDRMTQEGYVEASSNRRLGKRVIHSSLTERKLNEVRKVLDPDDMDVDVNEAINKTNGLEAKVTADVSTCGGIHSIGSDFTRTKGRSGGMQQNGSVLSEQTISKAGNTPISNKAQPAASRESFAVHGATAKEAETVNCSQASQDRRGRKTSMVRDPILQYSKRQKSQAN
ncbi:Winged helix DNA-binding domain superfamily [Arabidopsis suecica]|uniref:Winged helix DNA-binding domain superfamily n=1 Tax=Arabidopsis suecica TaxID=45249 RepID=A0A8T2BUA9_ARASU|nr:Winged helix DNA-binding domain superfamily [Arabidopsis suecica]